MNDRELLEKAAKAAGIDLWHKEVFTNGLTRKVSANGVLRWNPLTDDGDALRLAARLRIDVAFNEMDVFGFPSDGSEGCSELIEVGDPYAATRRAIVRAAAAITEQKEGGGK